MTTLPEAAEQPDSKTPDSGGPEPRGARRQRSRVTDLLTSSGVTSSFTFVVFVLVFAGYAVWLGDLFVAPEQRMLDVHQNVPLLLLAIALTICLACDQFDLSVGGMTTLSCYLTVGLTVKQEWSFGVVLVACLALGLLGGAINAFLVLRLRVNAFIATLGTGGIFGGLSTVYSGGTQLSPISGGPTMPEWFSGAGAFGSYQTKAPMVVTWLVLLVLLAVAAVVALERSKSSNRQQTLVGVGIALVVVLVLFATALNGFIEAMPWTVIFLIVVAFAAWVALTYTSYGRYLYATGGNAEAAKLAGVKVSWIKASAFIISGVLSATAGIVLAGIQGSASPDIGAGFLLPAFAAAFLSTVLLSTGRFHIWGAIIGGIFLLWTSQGLVIGGVSFTYTSVINGLVLLGAVALSTALRKADMK